MLVRLSSSYAELGVDTAEVIILPGMLKVSVTPTTLQYGQSAQIVAEGIYRRGQLVPLGEGFQYSYEIIQSTDAGYMWIASDTSHTDLKTGSDPTAVFVASEESPQPDSVLVIVKVTASEEVYDARIGIKPVPLPHALSLPKKGKAKAQDFIQYTGVARVTVKKEITCAQVRITPSQLAPDDTATVEISREDGTAFPANAEFNVWIASGGSNTGTLISEGGSGVVLSGVHTPLRYVAPETIEGSSIVVKIAALESNDGGGNTASASARTTYSVKKLFGRPAIEAMSKTAQDLAIAGLEKRLSEGQCPLPAEVSVSIKKYCQTDYPNVRYDKYVRKKAKSNIDSVDANGNLVYMSVSDQGCALACMAMIAAAGGAKIDGKMVDPGNLAEHMNDPRSYGFVGHGVKWNAIDGLDGATYARGSSEGNSLQFKKDAKGNTVVDAASSPSWPKTNMDQFLAAGDLIIAWVFNPTTRNAHAVVVTGKTDDDYTILDPGCYQNPERKALSFYKDIYKFIVYKK